MERELDYLVSALKALYLSTLANLPDTMKNDLMNGQRDQDRLARAQSLLLDLEKKYKLDHWDYLDHPY